MMKEFKDSHVSLEGAGMPGMNQHKVEFAIDASAGPVPCQAYVWVYTFGGRETVAHLALQLGHYVPDLHDDDAFRAELEALEDRARAAAAKGGAPSICTEGFWRSQEPELVAVLARY